MKFDKNHNADNSCNISIDLGKSQAAFIAFVVPAIIYFIFRISLFPLFNSDPTFVFASNDEMSITSAFSTKWNPDYMHFRPLSKYFETKIGYVYKLYGEHYHTVIVTIVSLLIGLLSWLIFSVSHFLSRSTATGLLASFLYSFSLAGIAATWHNLFTALMLAPLLLTCGAIFSYFRFRVTESKVRWIWLSVFIFLSILAPWFREFGYVPAMTVFTYELLYMVRKRSLSIVLPAFLFVHALAPKALASIIGLYDGKVSLFFKQGDINKNIYSQVMGGAQDPSMTSIFYPFIKGNTVGFILNEIPPILWGLIIVSIAISSKLLIRFWFNKEFWLERLTLPPTLNYTEQNPPNQKINIANTALGLTVFALLLFFIYPLFPNNLSFLSGKFLPLLFLLFLAIFTAFQFGVFISIWLIVTVPSILLLATNHEIHTSFAMIPLSIICSLWIRYYLIIITNLKTGMLKNAILSVSAAMLALSGFDHISNIGTSFLAIQNVNTAHQHIGRWLSDNAKENSVIFVDFFASRDILYRTSYPGTSYEFKPIRYKVNAVFPTKRQLEILKDSAANNIDVYYLHLRTYSTDLFLLLPQKALKKMAAFEIDNVNFAIDPLRLFIDKKYIRNFTPSEWDTSYGWVGLGATRFIWRAEVVIYKIINSKVSGLTVESFIEPVRHLLPPIEVGSPKVTQLTLDWHNNHDTSIISYEKFSSTGSTRINVAVNHEKFGIASSSPFSGIADHKYEVKFNLSLKSGEYPTFRISKDPYGNASILNFKTVNGQTILELSPSQTGTYYAVFRVEDGQKTNYSVNAFSIKEKKSDITADFN